MSKLKTLVVQAQLRWKDPARNRAHLESLIAGAAGGFDLAVLPETFTTGFLGDTDLPAEDMGGPTVEWMKTMAAQHESALAGSAVITEDGHRYNRFIFVEPDGSVQHYDKRHLFAFGGENKRYTAGHERVIVNYRGWRINLQVCYDLRFPVWCRNRNDYDLMLLVANWPSKRVHHWSLLLEARAIENQAWIIGVNRVGEDGNGLQYPGCSVVHDPSGACTANLAETETTRVVEMDLARIAQVHSDFPFQADADDFQIADLS
ncbi:MAG: amidohydrolase [Xanthomonadales bacterium]|nr:amidohydrolase [Gammaproteobacteria bacterium]MBT8053164.1 amidohydrolase [Gammaproteobacteria bacterium]NND56072.1 amidohydrolase [Xanthomonadales bacterium]NNK50203.1 amidohydrolase [Xanthomonadales bacterium]